MVENNGELQRRASSAENVSFRLIWRSASQYKRDTPDVLHTVPKATTAKKKKTPKSEELEVAQNGKEVGSV